MTQELEFVAETNIPGAGRSNMSLCYVTESFRILGIAVTSDVQRYALSQDGCVTEDRPFSTDQMVTAQSLELIAADIPVQARNDLKRNLRTYGFWSAVILALFAVVWRRVKSLMGFDMKGPMRIKAAQRILSAMCHAAKCDGLVDSRELTLVARTARRLTGRIFATADIIRIADHVDVNLSARDYIAFGKGLRDREKDVMMRGVLYIAMADGRMLPVEYHFVTQLAHGLGMPAEDFRRVLNQALTDLTPA